MAVRYLLGCKGDSGFGSSSTANEIASIYKQNVDGKNVIITGCTGGIGKETVRALAKNGAKVFMACRNMEKCKATANDLIQDDPQLDLVPIECDLSSFESIRKFVKEFEQFQIPLHILCNNAGVMACPYKTTVDGHEMQFGTNHLGHFLLTELLIDSLKKGAPSRVVMVASSAHGYSYKEGIRFDSLNDDKSYSRSSAYGQSKLANILHAKELNERFEQHGLDITANALHPGVIATDLQRHISVFGPIWNGLGRPFHKNQQQGAATTVYVATAPGLTGGKYYADCNEITPSVSVATDKSLWKKLRETSKTLTKADCL